MTNNTINNVPCELLETLIEQHITAHGFTNHTARQAQLILCAPSPAGGGGLEVVAWRIGFPNNAGYKVYEQRQPWAYEQYGVNSVIVYEVQELCRLPDAQAIIDGLRVDVEVMTQHANNYSRMFEECAEERDQQAQRVGELEGLLRDSAELIKHGVFEDGYCCCGSSVDSHGLSDGHSPVDALAYHAWKVCERIDAALSSCKDSAS